MMDPNNRQFDFLQPLSPVFGLFKASPYLSPIIDFNSIRDSQPQNHHDLLNFRLEANQQEHLNLQIQNPQIDQFDEQSSQPEAINSEHQQSKKQDDEQEDIIDQNLNPPLVDIIRLLINYSSSSQQDLQRKAIEISSGSKKLMEVYKILLKKFKKLKKTKEEMTKYCMRKAFKCITDKSRNSDYSFKKSSSPTKSPKSPSGFSSIFKKITTQKTMNVNFLRKIFKQDGFLQDYEIFLRNFNQIIYDDNEKKVRYLASIIQGFLNQNNMKKIENIKRLPWTRQILQKTEKLGRQLPKYGVGDESPVSRKKS